MWNVPLSVRTQLTMEDYQFPFFWNVQKPSLTIGSIRSLYNGNIVAVWCDQRHAIGTLGYNVADSQARAVNSIYRPLHYRDREILFTCKPSEKKTAARPHRGEVSRSLSLKCRVSKTTGKPGQRLPPGPDGNSQKTLNVMTGFMLIERGEISKKPTRNLLCKRPTC